MTLYNFIFDGSKNRKYRHITFWLVWFVYLTLNNLFQQMASGNIIVSFAPVNFIILELIEVASEMAFTYLVVYILMPLYSINHKKLLALTGCVISFLGMYCAYYFIQDKSSEKLFYNLWFITGNFIGIGPLFIFFLFLSVKMMKNYYLQTEEREQKQREKTNAEMQVLKAQVHPHFLFNTLNNIYSFTISKSPQAPVLVDKLNSTLNYMINECKAQFVFLQKEIQSLTNYIELEKVRYGNRLMIEVTITGEYADKMITPLLLIPFVENSFKHGASKMLGSAFIKINIEIKQNILCFSLANNKPVADNANDNKRGIGLSNVKKRLQLLYPSEHYLLIQATEDIFIVEMHVPLQSSISKEDTIITKETISAPA